MAKPAKKAAKKAPAKKSAAKKAAGPVKTIHYLPPWVVVTKSIDGGIIGLDPQFKHYTVTKFDANSGWVELTFEERGALHTRRTHCNNIVIAG